MDHKKQTKWAQGHIQSQEIHDDHADQKQHPALLLRQYPSARCLETSETEEPRHRCHQHDTETGRVGAAVSGREVIAHAGDAIRPEQRVHRLHIDQSGTYDHRDEHDRYQ